MARRPRGTGIGRGNGPGSAKTQFKDGMPSANPQGRPKKPRRAPPETAGEAIVAALMQTVEMTIDKRAKKTTQLEAMIEVLCNDFARATPGVKLRILGFLTNGVSGVPLRQPHTPSAETIEHVLAKLASEGQETDDDYLSKKVH